MPTVAHSEKRTPADGRLATVPEVAAFLDVSRSKVYQMMDQGVLPYVKLGRSRRVPWDAVQRLVEENLVSGQS